MSGITIAGKLMKALGIGFTHPVSTIKIAKGCKPAPKKKRALRISKQASSFFKYTREEDSLIMTYKEAAMPSIKGIKTLVDKKLKPYRPASAAEKRKLNKTITDTKRQNIKGLKIVGATSLIIPASGVVNKYNNEGMAENLNKRLATMDKVAGLVRAMTNKISKGKVTSGEITKKQLQADKSQKWKSRGITAAQIGVGGIALNQSINQSFKNKDYMKAHDRITANSRNKTAAFDPTDMNAAVENPEKFIRDYKKSLSPKERKMWKDTEDRVKKGLKPINYRRRQLLRRAAGPLAITAGAALGLGARKLFPHRKNQNTPQT